MRLSMPMVVQWLKAYKPVATIRSSQATIVGIRHLNNDRDPEPDYIYVGKICDLFPGSISSEVVLVHRQDVVSLKTAALEEVYDCLSDALVFYQNWEDELMGLVRRKKPCQLLINASEQLLGAMFFADTRLHITAASRFVEEGKLLRIWRNFWEKDRWKCEEQQDGVPGSFAGIFERVWTKPVQLVSSGKDEFPFATMVSQTDGQGRLLGQMILLGKKKTAPYQQPMLTVLAQALEYSGLYAEAEKNISVEGSMARKILENPLRDRETESVFLRTMGWEEDLHTLVVVLRKEKDNRKNILDCLRYFRGQRIEGVFILSDPGLLPGETVIVCFMAVRGMDPGNICEADARVRLRSLFSVAGKCGFTLHISYHQQGVSSAHLQYRQALIAASMGETYFYNCALRMLTSFSCDRELCLFSLHPTPGEILAYDKDHKTEYYQMLYTYLRCERNRNETARQLYVHKNTLAYRLQKMEELFRLQLDDPYEREFLLLTMLALSQTTK